MKKSLNISSYVVLIGVIVSVISSCAMRTELCSVKTHSKCVPIESYKGWNECIVQFQEMYNYISEERIREIVREEIVEYNKVFMSKIAPEPAVTEN